MFIEKERIRFFPLVNCRYLGNQLVPTVPVGNIGRMSSYFFVCVRMSYVFMVLLPVSAF